MADNFEVTLKEFIKNNEAIYGSIKLGKSKDKVSFEVDYEGSTPSIYAPVGLQTNQPCYASFLSQSHHNKIICHLNYPKKIKFDDVKSFIDLFVRHKMCPADYELEENKDGKIQFSLKSENKSLLYAGLCAFRYIDSSPALVATVLHLSERFPNQPLVKILISSLYCSSVNGNGAHDPIFYHHDKSCYDTENRIHVYDYDGKKSEFIKEINNPHNVIVIMGFITFYHFNQNYEVLPCVVVKNKIDPFVSYEIVKKFHKILKEKFKKNKDSKLSFMDSRFDPLYEYSSKHDLLYNGSFESTSLLKLVDSIDMGF